MMRSDASLPFSSYIKTLGQLVKACQYLQEMLEKDRLHFDKRAIRSIEESNEKKLANLDKMNKLVNELKNEYPEHFSKILEQDQQSVTAEMRTELNSMISNLKKEIGSCAKLMSVNGQIISSNLQQIKEIWDKVASFKASYNDTYDHTGRITRK